jgi:hypothetical protein
MTNFSGHFVSVEVGNEGREIWILFVYRCWLMKECYVNVVVFTRWRFVGFVNFEDGKRK